MLDIGLYLIGIALAVAVALTVILIFRVRFLRILTELCQSEERAAFWTLTVNLTMMLTVAMLAMAAVSPDDYIESSTGDLYLWNIFTQLKYGVAGMIASLLVISIVIARSIESYERGQVSGRYRPPTGSISPSLNQED